MICWIQSEEFLFQWAGDSFHFPLDEPQLENYIQVSESDQPTRKIFKVVELDTNAVVGHIDLDAINLQEETAKLCRVLVGEFPLRRKGIGVQMVRKVLEIGFDQLGLLRIDLSVCEFNEAAIRCYEKVGFVKYEHVRNSRKVGNKAWGTYRMSMLKSDWTTK